MNTKEKKNGKQVVYLDWMDRHKTLRMRTREKTIKPTSDVHKFDEKSFEWCAAVLETYEMGLRNLSAKEKETRQGLVAAWIQGADFENNSQEFRKLEEILGSSFHEGTYVDLP